MNINIYYTMSTGYIKGNKPPYAKYYEMEFSYSSKQMF